MTKIAIVFPGQGSQSVGMGQDFLDHSEEARQLFEEAFNFLGDDYKNICFEGPKESLTQTQYAQPLIFLISAVIFNALKKEGITAEYLAGHSLGELTAYYAAGVLNLTDTLSLIKKRGEAMAAAHPSNDSAMCAVIGSEQSTIESAVEAAPTQPVVAANYNCPSQIVISGKKAGVAEAKESLQASGAKCIDLPVSGAFHSPLMTSASETLKNHVSQYNFSDAKAPILLNRTAEEEKRADALEKNISEQVISSVRWTQTIQALEAKGVDLIIECGPGKVLAGLIKKTAPIKCISVNSVASLETLTNEIHTNN